MRTLYTTSHIYHIHEIPMEQSDSKKLNIMVRTRNVDYVHEDWHFNYFY